MTDSENLTALLMAGAVDCLGKGGTLNCSKLADYLLANGVIVLPCKVGDIVYEVFMNHLTPFIQETTVEKIIITSKGLRIKLSRNSVYETSISALGKTIFLTKEEAEKALEERKQ